MARTFIQEAVCPACSTLGLDYAAEEIDLPYLGPSVETVIRCAKCGYRHADFILTGQHEAMRYRHVIRTQEDMSVRVVRSSSGTIRIPELGILIEPGVASEAFVSNIEGVVVRVERVLDQLHRDAEDEEARQRVEHLQDVFSRMREGAAPPVTLILEDPFGNSRILGDSTTAEAIPADEADALKVGMVVLDPEGNPWKGPGT